MAGDEVMRIKSEGLALAFRLLRPISFKYLTQSTIWEALVPMTPTNQRRYLNNDTPMLVTATLDLGIKDVSLDEPSRQMT